MKILVFENGEAGRLADINGENVQGEIEELLGGPVVSSRLTGNLHLVVREDGHKEVLPIHYTRYQPGDLPALIFGNCVVVKIDRTGKAYDMKRSDAETVNGWLYMAEG